jgi:hypothetical protein
MAHRLFSCLKGAFTSGKGRPLALSGVFKQGSRKRGVRSRGRCHTRQECNSLDNGYHKFGTVIPIAHEVAVDFS